MTTAELVATVAAEADRPIFAGQTFGFGLGIVGGPMTSDEKLGEAIGARIAATLKGIPAESLPVLQAPKVIAVDWRQLQKWGISEGRLPKGTEVRFREASAWERYRWQIVAAAGVLLLQAFVIGILLAEGEDGSLLRKRLTKGRT